MPAEALADAVTRIGADALRTAEAGGLSLDAEVVGFAAFCA